MVTVFRKLRVEGNRNAKLTTFIRLRKFTFLNNLYINFILVYRLPWLAFAFTGRWVFAALWPPATVYSSEEPEQLPFCRIYKAYLLRNFFETFHNAAQNEKKRLDFEILKCIYCSLMALFLVLLFYSLAFNCCVDRFLFVSCIYKLFVCLFYA